MPSRHLNSYKGRLDYGQIADGINAARRNARRLVEDARILLDKERYATAASLAVLSIEESGKQSILRQLATATTDEEVSIKWKDYRSHTKKNILWPVLDLFKSGARQLDDFLPLFEPEAEHAHLLNQVKQISFYTDCLGSVNWSEPSNVIDKQLASGLTQIADILARSGEVTAKEIELWVEHMGKVKNNDDLIIQEKALLHWYAEMQELELAPKGGNLKDFISWLGFNLE